MKRPLKFTLPDALVSAVDNKDRHTRRHSGDVLAYALEIARALDRVLRKPGKFTAGEYEVVQKHPLMGAVIVGAGSGFEDTLDAIRHHPERWDGGRLSVGACG